MRIYLAVSLLLLTCLAVAQDYPKAEVYGGYSYINIDTNNLADRQSANGWEGSVTGNFSSWLGVEMSVAGYYKTYPINLIAYGLGIVDVKVTDYSYGAGPRINFRPFFAHALIGGDHLTGSALGYSKSQDGLAGAFGGGIEWPVANHLAVRASADYVFTRHNIFGGPSYTQNNIRAGAGIVYIFGGRGRDRSARPTPAYTRPAQRPVSHATMPVSALGVTVAPREDGEDGAEIVDVIPGGVAELANIHRGNIIVAIEGTPVNSPMALAAAVANRAPGSQVHVRYLFRATAGSLYTKETVVILPKE